MLEFYVAQIEQQCSTEMVEEIRQVDFSQPDADELAYTLVQAAYDNDRYNCLASYLGYMSYKIDHQSPYEVIFSFLSAADRIPAGGMKMALTPAIKHAYQQFSYSRYYGHGYFYVLGSYGIDVRHQFDEQFEEVKIEGESEEAFYYTYYLTQIGDLRGIARFDQALKENETDDADFEKFSSLINGIRRVKLKEVIPILKRYENDHRRVVGVNGPETGPSIAEYVQSVLK